MRGLTQGSSVSRRNTPAPQELALILTSDCNLRCSYCYQDAKQPRAMQWLVLRAALDVLLASPRSEVTVSFSGGEPALEFAAIRQAVEYVDRHPAGPANRPRKVAYHLTTNGLLLGTEELAFLAGRDFLVDLSADGVPEAQDLRGRGTSGRIDQLLESWRGSHPDHFQRRCRVAITLTRPGIPHLAASFCHFLGRHVPHIIVQTALGETGWTTEDLRSVDEQLARVRKRRWSTTSRPASSPSAASEGCRKGEAGRAGMPGRARPRQGRCSRSTWMEPPSPASSPPARIRGSRIQAWTGGSRAWRLEMSGMPTLPPGSTHCRRAPRNRVSLGHGASSTPGSARALPAGFAHRASCAP
ncbi:MAG: radical SAM protein [Acidobacteria bacterium]|nr:MAG: radical SAM protein [Acidobacteriota bacterium]